MKTVAVFGYPAAGKTSIFKEILKVGTTFKYKLLRGRYDKERSIYWLGVFDGNTFEGTDRLSMAVQPDAVDFLKHLKEERPESTVVFEGDRLCTETFLTTCKGLGELVTFCVTATQDVLDARHVKRRDKQQPEWLAGRKTKVDSLIAEFSPTMLDNSGEIAPVREHAEAIAIEVGADLTPEPVMVEPTPEPEPEAEETEPDSDSEGEEEAG